MHQVVPELRRDSQRMMFFILFFIVLFIAERGADNEASEVCGHLLPVTCLV